MVFLEQPFHSLRMIPQTLEKVTLRAIRMQNDSVSIVPPVSKKLRPSDNPKNWLYHKAPANKQKRMLFINTLPFL